MAHSTDVLYDYIADRDGNLTVVKTQDVEPVLKAIHYVPTAVDKAKYLKSNQWYLGSVPSVIGLEWARQHGVRYLSREWKEIAVKKLRHDPEFSKLKIRF
jgi:endo-alpha-1,4-polygalactosaminidase (GH114 family)